MLSSAAPLSTAALNAGITAYPLTLEAGPRMLERLLSTAARIYEIGSPTMADVEAACLNLVNKTTISDELEPYEGQMTRWEMICYFLYEKQETSVGFAGLYRYLVKPNEYWLANWGVVPEQRGRGVGTIIVAHLMQLLTAHKASVLYAFTEDTPNNGAHEFYLKIGWIPDGREMEYQGRRQTVYRAPLFSPK